MPQGKTYVKIASQTTGAVSSVTFSNIPQNFTDLRLVVNGRNNTSASDLYLQFNGDTGSNYSFTYMTGTGSTATSGRGTSTSYIICDWSSALPNTSSVFSVHTIDIMNYSNGSTYKTAVIRASSANSVSAGTDGVVGVWRNTNAITSLLLKPSANSFDTGSTFTLYGIEAAKVAKASGGDVVYSDGTYWYHKFLSSGVFSTNTLTSVDYLVVAGGGGAAGYISGGGGGGGGVLTGTGLSVTANTTYAVSIGGGGGGGAKVSGGEGLTGSNSVFSSVTAYGGGGGSHAYPSSFPNDPGKNGGSGGGGGGTIDSSTGSGGTGTAGQGNNGGAGANRGNGGGGGGAGGAGTSGTGTVAGKGGAGITSSFTGSSVYYGAGGGGGYWPGVGESFAGAATGGVGENTPGNPNTGQGASSGNNVTSTTRLSGGSGIVILRYSV